MAALPAEVTCTRAALIAEVTAARKDALARSERQIAALRKDVLAEAAQIRETADRRIGDTLARADTALTTVESLRTDVKPTLDRSAAIAAQVDDALPLFLDCDHNPDCVFNRYVGVSKGVERAALNFGQMSQDVRGSLPKMLVTWDRIAQDVSGTAGNVNRLTKPRWYDRLLGYGLNGIVIYRNLNPATNLTVKGAQILSARP
jgi:ABC-type transporter Mla subunit MlaD